VIIAYIDKHEEYVFYIPMLERDQTSKDRFSYLLFFIHGYIILFILAIQLESELKRSNVS
jgi:hypothetical protein